MNLLKPGVDDQKFVLVTLDSLKKRGFPSCIKKFHDERGVPIEYSCPKAVIIFIDHAGLEGNFCLLSCKALGRELSSEEASSDCPHRQKT